MTNMERICSMSKNFDAMKSNGVKLKLASGDILLGSNPMTNKVASHFLNWIGVTANALGNHEMDATPDALASTISDAKYKLLAANVTVKADSPMAGKIQKSKIEEYNGQKFGIIGTAPSDALERVGTRESLHDFTIDDISIIHKRTYIKIEGYVKVQFKLSEYSLLEKEVKNLRKEKFELIKDIEYIRELKSSDKTNSKNKFVLCAGKYRGDIDIPVGQGRN